jgi:hypothetical protein
MEIKRDVPVGILFIIMSMFPLIYVWEIAKEFWVFIGLILCMRIYDLLFDFGFAKLFGAKVDKV